MISKMGSVKIIETKRPVKGLVFSNHASRLLDGSFCLYEKGELSWVSLGCVGFGSVLLGCVMLI